MEPSQPKATLFERIGGQAGLSGLLKHFYADLRQHSIAGPIFAARISDWPAHMDIILDFWTRITGGPSTYSRPMPAKHFDLGLEEQHFSAWLDLWRRHCRARLEPTEAQELIAIAESLGERLRHIVTHERRMSPLGGTEFNVIGDDPR